MVTYIYLIILKYIYIEFWQAAPRAGELGGNPRSGNSIMRCESLPGDDTGIRRRRHGAVARRENSPPASMIPKNSATSASKPIEISRDVLQASHRASRVGPVLLRSGNIELTDQSTLEVLTPLLKQEGQTPVRVLHVDDNPELADVTAEFLKRFDVSPVDAAPEQS